jgi:hypothetical protein
MRLLNRHSFFVACGRRRGPGAFAAICVLGVIGLGGCSMNDGVGKFTIDPAHYSAYHCKDFAPRLAILTTREQQLRNLMDKANESGGGAVIGALSYRADYESVLGEEKVLRHAAAEKNCDLSSPTFQSDQTIR